MKIIIIYTVLIIILVAVARLLFLVVPGSGLFINFDSIAVDQCQSIEVAPGPEDMQIDHQTGVAYIAVADRRDKSDERHVGIYVLDLNDLNTPARRLEGDLPEGFTPHGISLWTGPAGERRLFVVNHPRGEHSIEIFSLGNNDRLTHLETISSETFTFPNDVVAVGARQFYVSNMQRASGGISLTLELYLGLPITDVVYFDGSSAVSVATGLVTANGVNVSEDGTEFYVAEAVAQRVNIFKRDPETGELSERRRISINTGPDNIDLGSDGWLYMGSHPDLLAFTKHAVDPNENSPSHVVRLNPKTGEYQTVFMSINGEINGSSTGPYWNGQLLVGGVFESHVMHCQLM